MVTCFTCQSVTDVHCPYAEMSLKTEYFLKSIYHFATDSCRIQLFRTILREKVSDVVNSGRRHRSTVFGTKHKKNGQSFSRTGPIESGLNVKNFYKWPQTDGKRLEMIEWYLSCGIKRKFITGSSI